MPDLSPSSSLENQQETSESQRPSMVAPRWLLLLAVMAVVGLIAGIAGFQAWERDDGPSVGSVTLVSPTTVLPESGSMLAHLTFTPGIAGANNLRLRLTTWTGDPISPTSESMVDLTAINLGDSISHEVDLVSTASGWEVGDVSLDPAGWWVLTATIGRQEGEAAQASFVVLLPDPNIQGFDAPPEEASDPAAERQFEEALTTMTGWSSARWTEQIGSGLDVLVVGDFAVTEPGGGRPTSRSMELVFSGSFAANPAGTPPAAPTFSSRGSIAIGDQGWMRTSSGDWLAEPPVRFQAPSEWRSTYDGATGFQFGMPQSLAENSYDILYFHLPEQSTRAEAWFVWWIDPTTGYVARIDMVSRMHYMTWIYRDIELPFTIFPPGDQPPGTPEP